MGQSKNKKPKLDQDTLTVKITNNETKEVLFKQNVVSVVFAAVIESKDAVTKFASGVSGEFNGNSLFQSLEAILDVVAQTGQENYNLTADKFMKLMAKMLSEAVTRNFTEEEQLYAMLNSMLKGMDKAKN